MTSQTTQRPGWPQNPGSGHANVGLGEIFTFEQQRLLRQCGEGIGKAILIRSAQAQDKSDERAREPAKLDAERDRELEKVRAEHDREIAGVERDADKESDPAKAREKRTEKLREAELGYREKVTKINANYAEKAAKFRCP